MKENMLNYLFYSTFLHYYKQKSLYSQNGDINSKMLTFLLSFLIITSKFCKAATDHHTTIITKFHFYEEKSKNFDRKVKKKREKVIILTLISEFCPCSQVVVFFFTSISKF